MNWGKQITFGALFQPIDAVVSPYAKPLLDRLKVYVTIQLLVDRGEPS